MLCIYHSVDLDGVCSAAILKYLFPGIDLLPMDYSDFVDKTKLEPHKGEKVFVCDFCLPVEDMVWLDKNCDLVWCDHHITSIENMKAAGFDGTLKGYRTVEHSGCFCTWTYLRENVGLTLRNLEAVPNVVRWLSEYDCGRVNETILDFQYGIKALLGMDPTNVLWRHLFESRTDWENEVLRYGSIARSFAYGEVTNLLQTLGIEMKFLLPDSALSRYRIFSLNAPSSHDLAVRPLELYPGYDLFIRFCLTPGGLWRYTISKSSSIKIHLGEECKSLAERYPDQVLSGGGHEAIAGMSTRDLLLRPVKSSI